ncbi:hypothetical protein QO004_001665 [Rhizobium mesoamericanum]|uniref:GNAT family N-acetyltransferase n=1 Tax=Rhizobium mesoamericanum TaxID=1079800 RepID=UPI00277F996B|nr:GNAT family N-acetyltransferase [Rhizobium mesoamericanum]MDQ0559883.1 hypothetical protein [Rhizobium mesoamericanum]
MFSIIGAVLKNRRGYQRGLLPNPLSPPPAQPLAPISSGAGTSCESMIRIYYKNSVEAVPLQLQTCHPDEWDAFAQKCGASFRSAHAWLRSWSLKTRFQQRLKLFEFYQSGQKIGQCAVGISASECSFLDGLALKPGSDPLWADCMAAVLAHLGPGQYRYGWHLTLEQGREVDLESLPGVTVESVSPFTVQAVDFRRWSNWDEYWASTSSNTRRNAKRGEKAELRVAVRTGFACLFHLVAIARLRSVMYERKGIQFDRLRTLVAYVGGHLTAPQYRLAAIASEGKQPMAGFIGYEFGTHTYYLAGGSRGSNNGAAWYLQKLMLQRAWERSGGCAKYVLGYVDYAVHDEAVGGGLLRSRRSVNASNHETSIVTFRYEQT